MMGYHHPNIFTSLCNINNNHNVIDIKWNVNAIGYGDRGSLRRIGGCVRYDYEPGGHREDRRYPVPTEEE